LHRTGGAGHLVASGVNEGIRAGRPVHRLRRDGCGIAATHLLADHVAGQERKERKSSRSMLLSGLRAFFRPELGLAFFLRPIGWRYLFVHRDGSLIVAFALLGRVGLARHTFVNRIVDGRIDRFILTGGKRRSAHDDKRDSNGTFQGDLQQIHKEICTLYGPTSTSPGAVPVYLSEMIALIPNFLFMTRWISRVSTAIEAVAAIAAPIAPKLGMSAKQSSRLNTNAVPKMAAHMRCCPSIFSICSPGP